MSIVPASAYKACRFCGDLRRPRGLLSHERTCPHNPDRAPYVVPGALCCLRCRTEMPSPRRLAFHVEAAHSGEPMVRLPPPAPRPKPTPEVPPVEPPPAAPVEPPPAIRPLAVPLLALPSCGCGRPFAVDPADPDRRCLYCSGAYARATGYAVAAD